MSEPVPEDNAAPADPALPDPEIEASRIRSNRRTILECPTCFDHRASILATRPPKAECVSCGHVYSIKTVEPINALPQPETIPAQSTAEPVETSSSTKSRKPFKSRSEKRSLLIADAEEAGTLSIAPPMPTGTLTKEVDSLVFDGPDALRKATHQAAKLSSQLGEEIEAQWLLVTDYLKQLAVTHQARARYALCWRPRFLAVMSLSRSSMLACRAAKISHVTVSAHRRNDPDFEAQCKAAEEHAVQLLHDACFKSVVEGDCEPVYWQGIKVGSVRKFDSRLRVEFLRAYHPDRFKTPGQQPININTGTQVFALDPQSRGRLMDLRRAALERMVERRTGSVPHSEAPALMKGAGRGPGGADEDKKDC